MVHSNARHSRRKGSKPHPDFPLFRHATGRWAKKVRGKFEYFGKIDDDPDGQAALNLWLEQKDYLLAGRRPPLKTDELTVGDLANRYLTFKTQLLKSGELAKRTFDRYYANCATIVAFLGKTRPVDDLQPDDFQELRASIAEKYGPVSLANEIQMTRSLFKYGFDNALLSRPIVFGQGFRKPSAKTLRRNRVAKGPKMFTAEQIRKMLEVATVNMKAMILLAINGGLGNTDLALIPVSAVNLRSKWLNYPRPKTAIERKIPLWPETVAAIRVVKTQRKKNHVPDSEKLLFVGVRGTTYVCEHLGYRVNQEAAGVIEKAKIKGRTFYDLRRTFQTIAEGCRDLTAVQSIMGHAPAADDMSAIYRQRVDDERLLAVVNYVHDWLFPKKEKK